MNSEIFFPFFIKMEKFPDWFNKKNILLGNRVSEYFKVFKEPVERNDENIWRMMVFIEVIHVARRYSEAEPFRGLQHDGFPKC